MKRVIDSLTNDEKIYTKTGIGIKWSGTYGFDYIIYLICFENSKKMKRNLHKREYGKTQFTWKKTTK